MASAVKPRYRAFISYSHRDREWAEWLHKRIEGWHVPADLAGRETPTGPVPAKLRPVFRDRDELSASHSLADRIREALDGSQHLIVICSPRSAQSPYVNEEIRLFKSMGRSDRVLAVIVDGEPGDPARDCFPPALRFKLAASGEISAEREEPIAADAREVGDGRELAALKVISGLLGVGLDVVRRREARAQRLRTVVLASTAVVMTLLAMTAGVFGVIAEQRRRQAEQNFQAAKQAADNIAFGLADQLRNTSGVPLTLVNSLLGVVRASLDGLANSAPRRIDVKVSQARLLINVSETLAAAGEHPEAHRSAVEAARILEEAIKATPEDDNAQLLLSFAYRYAADNIIDLDQVLAFHLKALAIRERLVAKRPDDATYLHELAVTRSSIGNVELQLGRPQQALAGFDTAHGLFVRAAEAAPRSDYKHDVAVALSQAGSVHHHQDRHEEAIGRYRAALPILRNLVSEEPKHVVWPQTLATIHVQISDAEAKLGRREAARENLETARALLTELARSSADHALLRDRIAMVERRLEVLQGVR